MKGGKIFVCLVAGLFGFAAFSCFAHASGPTFINSKDDIPANWTKENSPYVVGINAQPNFPVTIEPGVVVKFKQYGLMTFNSSVEALGTEKEKIIFTAYTDDKHGGDTNGDGESTEPVPGYWHTVTIGSESIAKFENASFFFGGSTSSGGVLETKSSSKGNVSVKNSEFKFNKYAGIYLLGNPIQTVEGNVFSNNADGLLVGDCTAYLTVPISDNSFSKNGFAVRNPKYSSHATKVDAKNNWWGDRTGPYNRIKNPDGKGDPVSEGVLFDPWIGKNELVPVIIIPGIMGSWKVSDEWKIDPILHSFNNLEKAMGDYGYSLGFNMFEFPYQWRNSNIKNAELLRDAINSIKDQTGFPEVDIVAHSMGGLLAREYIQSDYYENDVNQLITLGTPQNGAPKSYLMWEAGESGVAFSDHILEKLFLREAKKAGYNNLYSYIRGRPMHSVQEILPVGDYLFDLDLDSPRLYPDNYPQNDFLKNLNINDNVEKMSNVEFSLIYGKTEKENTIVGYKVFNAPAVGDFWEHGYPENYDNLFGEKTGIVYGAGDETVPVSSATAVSADKKIEIISNHTALPTEAQQEVIELLTGIRPLSKITSEGISIKEILLIQVYCPVDLKIITPSDKIIGTDFEAGQAVNQVKDATYINNSDEEEFIVIPNPEEGEYKILTEGTGDGEYKIEAVKIKRDESDPRGVKESTAVIEGTTQTGDKKEAVIEIAEDEVAVVEDADPPVVSNGAPSGELSSAPAETEISLETDEKSACKYSTEPKTGFGEMPSDFSTDDGLLHSATVLGLEQWKTYHFYAKCGDEAGNITPEDYEITFSIPDKTPPVITGAATTQPNANGWHDADVTIHFEASDGESGIESVTPDAAISTEGANQSVTGTATDRAGNSATFTVSGINIDKTAPGIVIESPSAKEYFNNQILPVKYALSDSLTPREDLIFTAEYDGGNDPEQNIDLSLENLGNHALKITVSDQVGNISEKTANFSTMTDINAIQDNVRHYSSLKLIKNKRDKKILLGELRQVEFMFDALKKISGDKRINPKLKEKLAKEIKKIINREIDFLVRQIDRKSPKRIADQAANLLIESLNFIRPKA